MDIRYSNLTQTSFDSEEYHHILLKHATSKSDKLQFLIEVPFNPFVDNIAICKGKPNKLKYVTKRNVPVYKLYSRSSGIDFELLEVWLSWDR